MELAELIDEKIAPLYRFALLLTGDAATAERALIDVCAQFVPQMEAYRNSRNRLAFCVGKIREHCLKKVPRAAEVASGVVAHFRALDEPDRSALALFYLGIFPAQEIAAILSLSIEQLSEVLAHGRKSLGQNSANPSHEH